MNAKTQLQEVKERLAQLDPNNRDNLVEIARLKTREIELTNQVALEEAEQAHEKRVTQTVESFDSLVDKIELKKYVGEGSDYQALKIRLKRAFMAQADDLSRQLKDVNLTFSDQLRAAQDRETQLQRQNESLQERLSSAQNELYDTTKQLEEMTNRRDAAADELVEAKSQIKQLEDWNQDLREQVAFGVKGSLTVIDDEETKRQEAELETQRLKDRTIYNLEWTNDLKKTHYKALKAINDEPIEFPYYEKTKYNVIPESDVLPFRSQHPAEQQPVEPAQSVDTQPVQNSVTQEGTFPLAETATPKVQAISPMAESTSDVGGTGAEAHVTRSEFDELKGRVDILFHNQGVGNNVKHPA